MPSGALGRRVEHDPRSLAYKLTADGTAVTVRWDRVTPVLDQGSLGSCTGNAACGVLGTDPFYATLVADLQVGLKLDEDEAVTLYSSATQLDEYPGTYPPDDGGSSGLGVAKACQKAGLISGYQHITSVAAAQTAIVKGPFIVGSDWFDGMDTPDPNGLVKATGSVRGGHEYECIGYNVNTDLWEFVNSWGTTYGVAGRFFYSSGTFAQLLTRDGDATVFTAITSPAPVPTPTPAGAFPWSDVDPWLSSPHWWSKATHAAKAIKAWKTAT